MRKLLTFAAFMALAVGVAACTGDDDDDDDAASTGTATPTPSPSPSGSPSSLRNVTINITGWPHTTEQSYVRVVAGTNAAASAILCRNLVVTGGAATVTTNNRLTVGNRYVVEIFSDLNADGNFDGAAGNAADHDYRTHRFTASTNSVVSLNHAQQTGPDSFVDTTWAANTACPGD